MDESFFTLISFVLVTTIMCYPGFEVKQSYSGGHVSLLSLIHEDIYQSDGNQFVINI